MKSKPLLLTIICVLVLIVTYLTVKPSQRTSSSGFVNYNIEVVLPEDYKEITPESTLVGYYNKRQNKLYIAFYDENGKKTNSNNTDKESNEKH